MDIKTILKRVWSAAAALALGLLLYFWISGGESSNLLYALLALDAVLFALALPCGVFGAAVVFAAWYVLDMNPASAAGVYLNTIVLLLLGAVQWFWMLRFWYPPEAPFQKLDLLGADAN